MPLPEAVERWIELVASGSDTEENLLSYGQQWGDSSNLGFAVPAEKIGTWDTFHCCGKAYKKLLELAIQRRHYNEY